MRLYTIAISNHWLPRTIGSPNLKEPRCRTFAIKGCWSPRSIAEKAKHTLLIVSASFLSNKITKEHYAMATSLKNPGKAVKSPSKLAHVVLRTNNYDTMRSFYRVFLGAVPNYETDILCFLGYDEEHHRIGIINMPDLTAKKPGSSGLEHIAFTYNDINDLALTYLQRKENGILPFWTVNHGPTMSVYYKDPDGNILETFTDNFERVEDMQAWMESKEYNTNPIGVDFDMEDVIKKLEAGVSFDEIKKRPDIGTRGIDTVPE